MKAFSSLLFVILVSSLAGCETLKSEKINFYQSPLALEINNSGHVLVFDPEVIIFSNKLDQKIATSNATNENLSASLKRAMATYLNNQNIKTHYLDANTTSLTRDILNVESSSIILKIKSDLRFKNIMNLDRIDSSSSSYATLKKMLEPKVFEVTDETLVEINALETQYVLFSEYVVSTPSSGRNVASVAEKLIIGSSIIKAESSANAAMLLVDAKTGAVVWANFADIKSPRSLLKEKAEISSKLLEKIFLNRISLQNLAEWVWVWEWLKTLLILMRVKSILNLKLT